MTRQRPSAVAAEGPASSARCTSALRCPTLKRSWANMPVPVSSPRSFAAPDASRKCLDRVGRRRSRGFALLSRLSMSCVENVDGEVGPSWRVRRSAMSIQKERKKTYTSLRPKHLVHLAPFRVFSYPGSTTRRRKGPTSTARPPLAITQHPETLRSNLLQTSFKKQLSRFPRVAHTKKPAGTAKTEINSAKATPR
jgi:hypothetical protein